MSKLETIIPKGWQKKQIKDLLDYERPDKYIVESDRYTSTGKTPVLTANKSFILGYTDEDFGIYDNIPTIIFDDFTTDSKYVDFPFKIKSSAIKILKNKKDTDLRFIFEKMKSITFPTGSHKRFYISQYQNMDIAIPPLSEQKKIAEILSTVDEKIQKTDEIIAATEKLKSGLMQELFTRGIGHTKFKKTKIGQIPEEWEVEELQSVTTKIGDGLHGTPKYSDVSEYYFINGNNISEREIKIYPETKKVSVEEHRVYKKELTDRSILLSINGTIGNVGFYKGEKVILGKSVAYINCDNKISKEFIAYQLETDRISKYFTKELTGTTIKNLSLGTIRRTPIFVPRAEEQQKITEILLSVDEKITISQKLKDKLTSLKRGLMQDLLTGKKRTI